MEVKCSSFAVFESVDTEILNQLHGAQISLLSWHYQHIPYTDTKVLLTYLAWQPISK
jgi:hypothetical protein